MFFITNFIIDTAVNHIFKAEAAKGIGGEPVIQFRIIHHIRIGRFIQAKFVILSDRLKERYHSASYTAFTERQSRLYTGCTAGIKQAGIDKQIGIGVYVSLFEFFPR